jgi:hypothetical protein
MLTYKFCQVKGAFNYTSGMWESQRFLQKWVLTNLLKEVDKSRSGYKMNTISANFLKNLNYTLYESITINKLP